jgi:hypothetical protein
MNKNRLRFFLPAALVATLGYTLCLSEAHAADTLVQAVGFVLTGSDTADVRAVDRAGCVFDIIDSDGTAWVTGRFYLNNVDPSRVTLQGPFISGPYHWVDESIRGQTVVYTDRNGTHQSSDYALRLKTTELDRVKRAWRYIYTHGCRSTASAY